MQRIIYIDVIANRARVSSRAIGTQGEVAVTSVSISFDESWNGLTRRLLWSSADGNSAFVLLDAADSDGRWTSAVPALPLSAGGECGLTVEGYILSGDDVSSRARSVSLSFYVEPNCDAADSAAESIDATVAQQLQTALAGKAALTHDHSGVYSPVGHTHTMSASDISCTRTQTGEPTASVQAVTDELYLSLEGKAALGHDHAGVYSPTDHDHADVYSPIDHDHAGEYSPTDHDHAGVYSPLGHDHAGVYSLIGHSHAGVYSPFSHTHTPDSIGAAPAATEISASLPATGWTGTVAPYTQTVAVGGITAATKGFASVSLLATDAQYNAAAASRLRVAQQESGAITFKAYGDKPATAIPIVIEVIG